MEDHIKSANSSVLYGNYLCVMEFKQNYIYCDTVQPPYSTDHNSTNTDNTGVFAPKYLNNTLCMPEVNNGQINMYE